MRDASPPTAVGRTCPTAYETKYVRVSHGTRSWTPRTASSCCQRQAIGGTVTSVRNAERDHPGDARRAEDVQRLAEVDLEDDVGDRERR